MVHERSKLESMDALTQSQSSELDKKLAELGTKDKIEEEFQNLLAEISGAEPEIEKPEKKAKIPDKDIDTALE